MIAVTPAIAKPKRFAGLRLFAGPKARGLVRNGIFFDSKDDALRADYSDSGNEARRERSGYIIYGRKELFVEIDRSEHRCPATDSRRRMLLGFEFCQ
ncbi:MAG TPA: hypothetical protein VMB26_00365 [Candidatus Binataceae bacterium]|nr:hypothetical protein [Candidatus Binataceae bacterium]